MPRKKKEDVKEVDEEVEESEELKVEPEVFVQCLRCGGKKHEPTADCDANG